MKNSNLIPELPEIWQKTSFNGHHSGYITTKVKKTSYGYLIHRFSNYVSLQYIRWEIYSDGFSKATIKVDRNYCPRYQITIYFDNRNRPINDADNTRSELKLWQLMRKQYSLISQTKTT